MLYLFFFVFFSIKGMEYEEIEEFWREDEQTQSPLTPQQLDDPSINQYFVIKDDENNVPCVDIPLENVSLTNQEDASSLKKEEKKSKSLSGSPKKRKLKSPLPSSKQVIKDEKGTLINLIQFNNWVKNNKPHEMPFIIPMRYECRNCKMLFDENALDEHQRACKAFKPKRSNPRCSYCGDEYAKEKIEKHEILCSNAYNLYQKAKNLK